MTPAQKAAAARKKRAAAAKAAATRKRKATAKKAAGTRKRKAATRKRKPAAGPGGMEAVRKSALFRSLAAAHPAVEAWEDEGYRKGGFTYYWLVSEGPPGTIRNLGYVRHKAGRLQRRTYDDAGDDLWVPAE
jgi:hypothetical protein